VVTRTLRRLAPPPRLTLSQWADNFRYLSPETSAEPGRWNTARAEYLRGIMDAVSDPRVERVVVMASARVGKTEVINNLVGFHIGQDPGPILVVYPTETAAEEWSRDKLAPMLRDSPSLRSKIAPPRSRDSQNTTLHKVFPSGRLYIVGANAPTGLAAKNIRVVCCDEVDRYNANAGGEGDPVAQAIKRTQNFWNRKIVLVSSPKLAGSSRIEGEYLASDQRRYFVPCPHCEHPQALRWAQVRWPKDGTPAERADAAAYHCEECGAAWTDAERWEAITTAARRGGGWRAENPDSRVAGFHLSVLYSPWRTIAETVAECLAATTPEQKQVFVNTALGETWQERGDAPEADRLLERREEWPAGTAPAGVLAVTAGVDVQGDRIEVYVWGWGRGLESWLLAREVIHGDPAQAAVWDALTGVLDRDYRRDGGGRVRVARAAVDTGGLVTQAVYSHLRRLRDPRLLAIKGADRWGSTAPVTGPTQVDVTEAGRKLPRGLRLWTVAVSTLKAELYRRLWLSRGDAEAFPAGWVHLPSWLDGEAVRQLVSEELRTVKDRRGFARQEWAKLRERNEALDCAVYARAALWIAGADRRGDRFWEEAERALGQPAPLTVALPEPAPEPGVPAVAPAVAAPAVARQSAWLRPRGGWLR
jgi:phage terminase large subunit GpA-like protein